MKKALFIIILLLIVSCSGGKNNTQTDNQNVEKISMPDNFPDIKVKGKASLDGRYLAAINYNDQHFLADFNADGELIWYDLAQNKTSGVDKFRSCYRGAEKKGVYYFFERVENRNNRYSGAKIVTFDESGKSSEYFYQLDNHTYSIDPHDAVVFDVNHFIIETTTAASNTDEPQHSYIQEVKDGQVVWSFDSEKYPELQNERFVQGDNPTSLSDRGDYMHFNSFEIDPKDGNLLVSYRNQCAILKINRETSELMWKCGGINSDFKIASDEAFYYQHSITITKEGHLLLFSNGFTNENAHIKEYEYDENNMTLTLINDIDLGYAVSNYGEVIKLDNGNYLVQRGQSPQLDRPNGFDEIDYSSGEVVFSVDFNLDVQSFWVDFVPFS